MGSLTDRHACLCQPPAGNTPLHYAQLEVRPILEPKMHDRLSMRPKPLPRYKTYNMKKYLPAKMYRKRMNDRCSRGDHGEFSVII